MFEIEVLNEKECAIVGYGGNDNKLTIPDSVTSLGEDIFK